MELARETSGRKNAFDMNDRGIARPSNVRYGVCVGALGLSIVLLLTGLTPIQPLAILAMGCAAGFAGFCLLNLRTASSTLRLGAVDVIDTVLAFLVSSGISALILGVLLHSFGADPYLAQIAAMTANVGVLLILARLFVFSNLGTAFLGRVISPQADQPRLVRLGFVAALVPSLAYIVARTVMLDYNATDFRYFWLAGDLWRQGQNPYDRALYLAHGAQVFNAGSGNPGAWAYPPWCWIISRTAAIFPYSDAQIGWRLLLAGLLLGSVLILGGRIARHLAHDKAVPGAAWYCIAMVFLACTMRSSVESLALGQTTHLVLLGLMLTLVACLDDRRWLGVLGLIILAMKPQIGLIVGMFLLGTLNWFPVLVRAGTIVLLLAVPPVLIAGLEPTIGGFLNGLAGYNGSGVNLAVSMTGWRHLAFELFGIELNAMLLALVGGAIAFLVGAGLYRRAADSAARSRVLGLVLLVIVNFAPLHTYESVSVIPVIVLMMGWPVLTQLAIGLGLLFIYRSDMVAKATGWVDPRTEYFFGSTIDSAAFLALLLIWTMAILRDRLQPPVVIPEASLHPRDHDPIPARL